MSNAAVEVSFSCEINESVLSSIRVSRSSLP